MRAGAEPRHVIVAPHRPQAPVVALLVLAALVGSGARAGAQALGGPSSPPVELLPQRTATAATLTVSTLAERRRPPVVALGGSPASSNGVPGTTAFGPCDQRCGPPPRTTHQCDDANRDGRCDIVFDPARQGGVWRAVGRFLLLSWLWDDRDR